MAIEAVFLTYGTPGTDDTLFTREAALGLAEQAKKKGMIISYRVEGGEETGRIVITMDEQKMEDGRP